MAIPYERSTSGTKAREEITKLLRGFGCESVGFMDDFADQSVLLAFVHRGQPVQMKASTKGWAATWLKEHPYSHRMRGTRSDHEARAIKQGLIAVNSVLRDWVKGQITAVEIGMVSFADVFLPYMLGNDGKPLIEQVRLLLLAGPGGEPR